MFEEEVKKNAGLLVGENLDAISIEELKTRIILFQNEISRYEISIKAKEVSRALAENFFKKS